METLRQLALAVHLFGMCAWIGGTLALTRTAAAADEATDPSARAALSGLAARILENVCSVWMSVGLGAGVLRWLLAPFVLGRDGHAVIGAVALLSRRSFVCELAAAAGLVFLHFALARRVGRISAERAKEPGDPSDGDGASSIAGAHRGPLRRAQRAVFILALAAMVAAAARSGG
jgi:hypothetical protein